MTKNEFKQGDRVRYIGDDDDLGYDLPLCSGMDYVVAKVNDSEVDLETPYIFTDVDINDVEPIQPLDRRTAFLTRLQSLLREFDAEIGDSGITRIEGVEITFGDNTPCIRYKHCTLNADNIMDFDKE